MTNEVVSHMGGIVDTEAHGDDQVDAGHHVYSQAPEVDKSSNIDLQNIDKDSTDIQAKKQLSSMVQFHYAHFYPNQPPKQTVYGNLQRFMKFLDNF